MLFAHDGNVEQALKESIMKSLEERKANACDTWNLASVLALAWGVKELVDLDRVNEVKGYITSLVGSNVELEPGLEVTIFKGDVKERKDKAMLIYRYQLV